MLKRAKHTIDEHEDAGTFLYADFFTLDQLERVKTLLSKYFITLKSENITANVYHAMKIDGKQRKERIIKSLNWICRPFCRRQHFRVFDPSCASYHNLYEDFKFKRKVYYAFVLQKREKLLMDANK